MVKVTLRNKPISKGRLSLYLDYYPPIQNPNTGKPVRREYLKMYILEKARTALEKQDNKEILKQAEMIRQRKQVEINKPEIKLNVNGEKLNVLADGSSNIAVYSIIVHLIAKKEFNNSTQINLTTGVYLVRLRTGDHLMTQKIVIR